MLPTPAQFSAVVDKLRARYPFVRDFAAWNEANHAGQPTFGRPDLVAKYYKVLRTKCVGCNILPASLLDNPNLVPWTLKLRKAILKLRQPEPQLWGLHNYSDVNRLKDKSTRELLAAVKGKVWITESGGVVAATSPTASKFPQGAELRRQGDEVHPRPADQARTRGSSASTSTTGRPTAPDVSWDSGLVSPDGAPRPAYQVLKNVAAGRRRARAGRRRQEEGRPAQAEGQQAPAEGHQRGQRNKRR